MFLPGNLNSKSLLQVIEKVSRAKRPDNRAKTTAKTTGIFRTASNIKDGDFWKTVKR